MVEKRFFVLRYRWLRFVQNVQNVKGNRVVGGDDLEFVTRKELNALTSPRSWLWPCEMCGTVRSRRSRDGLR